MRQAAVLLVVALAAAGCQEESMLKQSPRTLQVSSPAYAEGEAVPRTFTCQGGDVSPPLRFGGLPEGTRSVAVVFDDPDAPGATWVHWVFWNWPSGRADLAEGEDVRAAGARLGENSWGNNEYGGPCPPRGTHRYVFTVHALDAPLDLPEGASVAQLEKAMQGHVLAWGTLTGTYTRT